MRHEGQPWMVMWLMLLATTVWDCREAALGWPAPGAQQGEASILKTRHHARGQSSEKRPGYETMFYPSGKLRIEAYLFKPEGAGPFPVVVYNHGSRPGHEREERPFVYVGEMLVAGGYVVVVPERRGYGQSDGPTFDEAVGEDRGPRFARS